MADTLETLEIQIKHSSTGAADEINKVASAIRSVDSALKKVIPNLRTFQYLMVGSSINITDNSTNQYVETLQNIKQVSSGAKKATKDAATGVRSLADAVKEANPKMATLLSSLKRIAFYRIIRSVIKSITQAFSEGLQWAYQFSAGIEGQGNRFAQSLDRMKSASTQMKAQLGASFAGLLAAIEPILVKIINLITKVADAISQFFAAFTGTTYLKATETSQKFADNMKAGGAAAKEWKNQLLGFDEINRLNEPSKGGGGGGSGIDPSGLFEDTPLDKWAMKVHEIIEWLKKNLDLVKDIVGAIGVALLAWKIGNLVTQLTGLTPTMSKILGIAIAIGGAFLFVKGACDAWKNGVDWKNLALMISGVALAAAGLGLAFGHVGAAVALLVGGVAMCVIALHEWRETGELSAQTAALLSAGILAIGAGLALLTGSWIPLVIAAIVAIVVSGDKLNKMLDTWKQKFSDTWGNGTVEIADFAYAAISAIQGVIWVVQELFGWIVSVIQAFIDFKQISATNNGGNSVATWNGTIERPSRFASGGFPSEGELFLARENGAEMVGSIGGHTAVANNDQIVEGIRQGVYDAVVAANSNGNNDVYVKVFLDSREIKAGQERLARAWG